MFNNGGFQRLILHSYTMIPWVSPNPRSISQNADLVSVCSMCDICVGRLKMEVRLSKMHSKSGLLHQVWYSRSSSLMDIWKNKIRGLLALDRKQCRLVTRLLPGHCTLQWHPHVWTSQKLLHAGNVDRRRNSPTTDFVNAQLWLGMKQTSSALLGWSQWTLAGPNLPDSGPRTEDRALLKSHSESRGARWTQWWSGNLGQPEVVPHCQYSKSSEWCPQGAV
jgi:hypothetical protein